jgi:hypothetical protein
MQHYTRSDFFVEVRDKVPNFFYLAQSHVFLLLSHLQLEFQYSSVVAYLEFF